MSDRFDDDSLMGDPLAGLGSFIEAPSETPDGEVTTLDVDGLKTFFDPRRDEDHVPIQHVVCTTTHADTALRRLGLLVQRARVGWGCWGRDVEYDARYDVWRDSITSVDAEIISEDVKKRDDDGPRGVIHVVGSLNLADFRAQTKRNTNDGRRAMLQAEAMRDYTPRNPLDSRSGSLSGTPRSVNGHPVLVPSYPAAAIFSRPGHRRSPQPGLDAPSVFTDTDQESAADSDDDEDNDDVISLLGPHVKRPRKKRRRRRGKQEDKADDNDDEAGDTLASEEVIRYLRQYMSQAIPRTAWRLGAVIVNSAHGDVTKLLARGIEGIDKVTILQGDNDEVARLSLLGIHPAKHMSDPKKVLPGFTHHLFIQGSYPPFPRDVTNPTDPDDPKNNPTDVEIQRYTSNVVKELAGGVYIEPWAPSRPSKQVAVVVIGGNTATCKQEVYNSVQNGWPVVILEGSGGFADILAGIIRRVEQFQPGAGVDEYRHYLGSVDPLTAGIINRGSCHIIRRGTPAKDVTRLLEKSLIGDEILLNAWHDYATWEANARQQMKIHKGLQLTILLMGVFATGYAVLMTYLLILWGNQQPKDHENQRQWLIAMWTFFQWSVIGLPIVMSLMQAITNRLNPGGKWVHLRSASEALLSEIYFYRTQTDGYSPQEIKKEEINQTYRYRSKGELLQQQIAELRDALFGSEVVGITLNPYQGYIPPPNIMSNGDSGLDGLGPDDYVRMRLTPKIKLYAKSSAQLNFVFKASTLAINCIGALGTFFAAMAAYRYGSLQAWVAFTTCLVNSLTRYLDYTRTEWLHQKFNKTHSHLTSVATWWAALGAHADNFSHRNTLTELTEGLIREEVDSWGEQLQKAMDRERQEAQENNEELMRVLGQTEGYKQAMKSLGLESLNSEMIMNALSNPKGVQAGELFGVVLHLADQLGGFDPMAEVASAADHAKELADSALSQVIETAAEIEDRLIDMFSTAALAISGVIPPKVQLMIHDQDVRHRFLDLVEKCGQNVDHLELLDVAKQASSALGAEVHSMSQRQLLEVTKGLASEELANLLLNTVDPDTRELLMKTGAEPFVAEIRSLCLDDKVQAVSHKIVLNLLKDPNLKTAVVAIPPETRPAVINNLIESGCAMFRGGADPYTANAVKLFECTLNQIAHYDIDEMYQGADGIGLLDTTDYLGRVKGLNLEMLPKTELLDLLPKALRGMVHDKSQIQLAKYMQFLKVGTAASRVLQCTVNSPRPPSLPGSSRRRGADHHPKGLQKLLKYSHQIQERFVLATAMLSQTEINRFTKAGILKKMRGSKYFSEELEEAVETIDDDELRALLSRLSATTSNTYGGRMLDKLADNLTTFDLRAVLPRVAQTRLVTRLSTFRGMDVSELDRTEILAVLGYPDLVRSFSLLDPSQLQDLVFKSDNTSSTAFHVREFHAALPKVGPLVGPDQVQRWLDNTDFIDRLMALVDDDVIEHVDRQSFHNTAHLLGFLGDELLSAELSEMEHSALETLLREVRRASGDPVLEGVFEAVSNDLSKPELFRKFVEVFGNTHYRETMMRGMEQYADSDPGLLREEVDANPAGVLSKLGFRHHEVQHILKNFTQPNPQPLVTCLALLLAELETMVPYRLFQKAANSLEAFDLRAMVIDIGGRHKLAPAVYELVTEGLVEVRGVLDASGNTLEVVSPRKEILRGMDTLKVYESVAIDLRLLPQQQLLATLNAMLRQFTSEVGRYFLAQEGVARDKLKGRGTKSPRFLGLVNNEPVYRAEAGPFLRPPEGPPLCVRDDRAAALADRQQQRLLKESIAVLKSRTRMNPEVLETAFDGCDAASFDKRLAPDKKKLLGQFIDEEAAVLSISEFTVEELRWFFSYMTRMDPDGPPASEMPKQRDLVVRELRKRANAIQEELMPTPPVEHVVVPFDAPTGDDDDVGDTHHDDDDDDTSEAPPDLYT